MLSAHLVAAFLWTAFIACVVAREVEVEVFAPWEQQTSHPIHEVGEFLASSGKGIFFNYVDQLCAQSDEIEKLLSAEDSSLARFELLQLAISVAKPLISADFHDLMESMVDSAYFAPAVAFQAARAHLPDPCPQDFLPLTTADSHIKIICSHNVDDGDDDDEEHVYRSPNAGSQESLILAGELGSHGFCSAYAAAKEMVSAGKIGQFAVYPAALNRTASALNVPLAGFGVFLDIKNMEYRNVDETPAAAAATNQTGGSGEIPKDYEVAGVNLHTLQESHQEEITSDDLLILKDRLLTVESSLNQAEHTSEQEMKVWRMKDLGLQAAQRVHSRFVKGSGLDALSEWATLCHNFPRFASQLSSSKVSLALRNDLQTWYSSFAAQQLPSNSLYINGMRVDLSEHSFNFFDLLFKIQEELKLQHTLDGLSLQPKLKERLFEVARRVGDEEGRDSNGDSSPNELDSVTKGLRRIDVSKGGKFAVMFLNNLEKDAMYKQMGWPKNLRTLLFPSWSLHSLARNLYTFIAVIDPFSEGGASLLNSMNMLYQQQYPLRFGAVFVCDASSVHTDFCRIFADIGETYSMQQAFQFAFQLAGIVAETRDVSFDREKLVALAVASLGAGAENEENNDSMFGSLFKSSTDEKAKKAKKEQIGDKTAETFLTMLGTADKYMDLVTNSTTYLAQRNLPRNSYSINGIVILDSSIGQNFMQIISREQYILGVLVRQGKLVEKSKSIFTDLMKVFHGLGRYHVMLDETQPKYIRAWTASDHEWKENALTFSTIASTAESTTSQQQQHLVLAVPATKEGMQSALNTLSYLESTSAASNPIVLDLLWLPAVEREAEVLSSSTSVDIDANESGWYEPLVQSHRALLRSSASESCTKGCIAAYQQLLQLLLTNAAANDGGENVLAMIQGMVPDLKLESGTVPRDGVQRLVSKLTADNQARPFISLNGRILISSSSPSGLDISASDLSLLHELEEKRIGHLLSQNGLNTELTKGKDIVEGVRLIGAVSSFLGYYNYISGKRMDVSGLLREGVFEPHGTDLSTLLTPVLAADKDGGNDQAIEIYCLVDPLSLAGQRGAALVEFLVTRLGFTVHVLLTPRPEMAEFPLQNFYRFVLPVSGGEGGTKAVFDHLPRQHTLTTRVDVPEPWNVQTSRAIQDTDNLRCSPTACGDEAGKELTHVEYVLKSLLVAGQCLQTTVEDRSKDRYGLPPNGLQLLLYTSSKEPEVQADTLVMQNLGYYQLQVPKPGRFFLGLAAGRATQLFTLRDSTKKIIIPQGHQQVEEEVLEVNVRSFRDEVRRLVVVKRPGLEAVSLLEDQNEDDELVLQQYQQQQQQQQESLWSRMTRSLGTSSSSASSTPSTITKKTAGGGEEEEDKTIHVFSLASGHMYERLLRIMMLAVTRHTSQPVKFWLFENYLSPSFKAIAAEMAKEYGFEVGYVTYKWPAWLRQQTQQQRIIWGYKVLFLDVLFPLHVKKIIYVDADQVIRSDLKELWDMDLHGHAYAYTPFCTSRQETLGFQFWRQGYWKDHLQGRPYHISALYVVDLQRFRRRTVGDQLRAVYDNLSRDPNSLANLDQDLPNYAQHAVPIFSLPQEWLWCETWCSDESKAKAKTIDLCNNPLHKEPKLDMARRVISGPLFNQSWVQYDDEIRALAERVLGQQQQHQQ